MARYGQRPENALKRANEFMELSKPVRALDTLQEVFRNKKWAYNWSESVLEPIMFRYLELCVDLRKSHIAKEGLFQYRNMFQSVNVGSLEAVIRGYLRMAEERTESARAQSAQAVIDSDDLDNIATPESILLSAVSGEDAQDRSDRTILTPWVKFLWESYCQCLELLRTNAHVEGLYHDIARMAFQFCLKYARKTEFRKLCDKLRKHLEDICKLPVQTGNVSISKPETQQLNLETRLFQLDSAIQMELWQEAYKAIEDIHNLMNMSKKTPVAKTMANYYSKLALVFLKAGHCLFHAAALLKLFQLSREMKKNITQEELQKNACGVLVATLSIPLPSLHPEFDRFVETDKSPVEKAQKLAVLLGLSQPPTRQSLLKDIVRLNVVSLASPQLQQLYQWLEVDFDPLNLCSRVKSVIDTLSEDESSPLSQYVGALRDIALVRLVRQVAQVYQCIRFERLLQLAASAEAFRLERMLVHAVRHNDMQIRIDHANKCIHFGVELSESSRESIPEGPFLQEMPSEQVRGQLIRMAEVLGRAVHAIDPRLRRAQREKTRHSMVQHYHENKAAEHQRILQRHKIIEDRKEYIERLNTVKEEEENRRQEEAARQQALAVQRRLEQEREEREKRQQEREMELIKERHIKERIEMIGKTNHGAKFIKKLDHEEIKKMDAETIAQRELEELMKERRELQTKLKAQEKKVDYLERAKRIEEIPLIRKSLEDKKVQDQAFWETQEKDRIQQLIEARKRDVESAARLERMHAHRDILVARLARERDSAHLERLAQFETRLAAERTKRLSERAAQRAQKRKLKWLAEKQAAAERAEEEARLAREEEERAEREERERARAEEERAAREEKEKRDREHQEMLARVEARRRAKEEEVERKLQEGGGGGGPAKDSRDGGSSWRRGDPAPPSRETASRGGGGAESERGDRREESGVWRRGGEAEPRRGAEPWRPSRLAERHAETADDVPRGKSREDRPTSDEKGPSRDERGPPREERGPPREERGPTRDIREERGPSKDIREERGPSRDIREDRGLSRDIREDRGPSREYRDERGPAREERGPVRDERGPAREYREERGPLREDRERRDDAWRSGGGGGRDRDAGRERDGDRDRYASRRDDRYGGRSSGPDAPASSWRRGDAPPNEPRSAWRTGPKDNPRDSFAGRDRDGPRRDAPSARDGPRRDAPPRDAPPRDALARDGATREGPPRDAPRRDDPRRDEPQRDVSRHATEENDGDQWQAVGRRR